MLIDCHTHAFAEKIAPRAVQQLIDYYQLPTTFGGSLQDLPILEAIPWLNDDEKERIRGRNAARLLGLK
jgi:hypothetical protein